MAEGGAATSTAARGCSAVVGAASLVTCPTASLAASLATRSGRRRAVSVRAPRATSAVAAPRRSARRGPRASWRVGRPAAWTCRRTGTTAACSDAAVPKEKSASEAIARVAVRAVRTGRFAAGEGAWTPLPTRPTAGCVARPVRTASRAWTGRVGAEVGPRHEPADPDPTATWGSCAVGGLAFPKTTATAGAVGRAVPRGSPASTGWTSPVVVVRASAAGWTWAAAACRFPGSGVGCAAWEGAVCRGSTVASPAGMEAFRSRCPERREPLPLVARPAIRPCPGGGLAVGGGPGTATVVSRARHPTGVARAPGWAHSS